MSMQLSAWDVATQAGRRVFYEPATETIRQCPENYCLLVREGSQWVPFVDKAARITPEAVKLMLEMGWRGEMDGAVLADAVEEAFYGSQRIGG